METIDGLTSFGSCAFLNLTKIPDPMTLPFEKYEFESIKSHRAEKVEKNEHLCCNGWKKLVPDRWMGVKGILRNAYSNQKVYMS